jgi:hypothetical protein
VKLIRSHKVRIIKRHDSFLDTVDIYREALAFIVPIVDEEWDNIKDLQSKSQINYCENLIHATKENPNPKYNFDELFYKYPSYLRRSTIQDAIGIVSPHRDRLEEWESQRYNMISNGKKFKKKKPELPPTFKNYPTLYRGNMFIDLLENNTVTIKVYQKSADPEDVAKYNEQEINKIKKTLETKKSSLEKLESKLNDSNELTKQEVYKLQNKIIKLKSEIQALDIKITKMSKKMSKKLRARQNKLSKKSRTGDWVWVTVKLREQDLKYLQYNCYGWKQKSPSLIVKSKRAYLNFPYEKNIVLTDKKVKDQIICAVDLGVNTSATCSIIKYDGTVLARTFINQPKEKDRQKVILNRLRLKQKQGGNGKKPKIWAKINGYNDHIANNTVNRILKFALRNKADVIVCEYLKFSGKKHGKKAQELGMWRYGLAKKLLFGAHKHGMRFARVNPKNTSALAFDGSGEVRRDENNYSLCTFPTRDKNGFITYEGGKRYNTDLNASYNIGARYFIRELLKTVTETKLSQVYAKVPTLVRRTETTLSTLKLLVANLEPCSSR